MRSADPIVGGVELGGTKSIAVVARGRRILRRFRMATAGPTETLGGLAARLDAWEADLGPPAALGVAAFGPLGVDPARSDYGRTGRTPKPIWSGVDVLGGLRRGAALPVGLDTDVAGAALAEYRWGAARGAKVVIYLTIGTGIGGGVVVDGKPVHGRLHPEIGHIRVRRAEGDSFAGICGFHGDCLEGLASGPAIAAQAGRPAHDLDADHPIWTRIIRSGRVSRMNWPS